MVEGLSPDQERALRAAGLDPDQDYRVVDFDAMDQWRRDHPEWAELIEGPVLSYEASIIADTIGVPTPEHWADMTIHGTDDGWSVSITDDEGKTYNIPMGDAFDLSWDFYDAAGFFDVDTEKDIDTGSPYEGG